MHQPYRVAHACSTYGAYACAHHGLFDHSVAASTTDKTAGVILDGWLSVPEREAKSRGAATGSMDSVNYCLGEYLENGIEFVKKLNGQFNLLVWDDRTRGVYLVNDRYGLRPLQYALGRNAALYFAPEGKAILAADGVSGRLNLNMIINQLSWGRIWIGDQTFFQDISMLPPASILHWRDGKTTLNQYWDYIYQPEPNINEDFIDDAVETFRRAVARQTRASLRYGVSLSGGLDSRTVLAALAQGINGRSHAYSWGVSDVHDELAIARHTANRLGVPWQFIPLAPTDFISEAGRGVFLTEGLDLAVQSYGLKVYPLIQEQTDALLTGLALDLTLGGSYLSSAASADNGTADRGVTWALKKAALFSPDECLAHVQVKEAAEILDGLRQEAARIWQAGQNEHPADQCDRFFLRSRVWRYTFQRQAWQRLFVEDLSPTFDNEFIDCLLRIPPAWRANHRFYRSFLQRLEPCLMEIPYQRTMLPPAAPLEFWQLGAQLEQQREELYRDIWRATQGDVSIPYRRFFTNYDEWLRCDPGWIAMTDDLLLSSNSLSCERFLNRQMAANLIGDHRSGKSANHQKIVQLITLELFLRQFFN